MKKIKVGLIGFGTIGCGVVGALQSKRGYLAKKSGIDITVAAICDKDIKSHRSVKVNKKLLTTSIGKVLYDPDINIVVELVGGIHPAKDIVMGALRQGKHVVTANKALLSEAGGEIFALANRLGLSVGFEASVGGGIPIIKSLKEGFVANRFELIYGIINGTSNFILSKMDKEGCLFKDALKIAQQRGYAERDPSLDISGMDSAHKLSILAMLGFGIHCRPKDIYTEGISALEPVDIKYAREMSYAIKLLGIAKRSGDQVELRVHPTLIPEGHLLANVNGVYNAIFVKGDLVGDNLFYGQGAGALPTSSAVVSDIVSIAKSLVEGGEGVDGVALAKDVKSVRKMDEVETRYYLRLSALDKPGVLARIAGILTKYGISIASVNQKEESASGIMVPVVMMTHLAKESDMRRAIKEIDSLSSIKKKTVRIRVEG